MLQQEGNALMDEQHSKPAQMVDMSRNLNKMKNGIAVLLIIVGTIIMVALTRASAEPKIDISNQEFKSIQISQQRLPRIFWIYTDNEKDAEPYENDIFLNYYVQLAKANKYEVRYANSWNSYDWIKQENIDIITQTMSIAQIDERIHTILKIALLHDNGGILMNWGSYFIRQDFNWLEQMFDKYEGSPTSPISCSPSSSNIYIPQNSHSQSTSFNFSGSLIAAVPGSPLLAKAFKLLSTTISTGKFPFQGYEKELKWNEFLGVKYLSNSLETIFNIVVHQQLKKYNIIKRDQLCTIGMQLTNSKILEQFDSSEEKRLLQIITSQNGIRQLAKARSIKEIDTRYFINDLRQQIIKKHIGKFIDGSLDPKTLQRSSFLYRILSQPENKRVFIDPLPEREIQLCLVVMDPLTESQIVEASSAFDNQTYSKWKLVLPAADPAKKGDVKSPKVEVIPSYSTEVHIIEKALARHCPRKGYAVLLNKGENFGTVAALQQIADTVRPHNILGLLVNLDIIGYIKKATFRQLTFNRYYDGIVNPKFNKANKVLNYFRVFAIETFLQIPQMALRDIYGKYFEDRLIFLMDLLNLHQSGFPPYIHYFQARHFFLAKKNTELWNIAIKIKVMPKNFTIIANSWEQVNRQQIKKTRTRLDSFDALSFLNQIESHKIPFKKLVVYNDAKDFVSVDDRNGPDLIPKIVHQVWLGSSIPPAKQYFIEKVKKMYPTYEVKVWRENNVTRELFPTTYDRIHTLLAFNKHSPFNKLATVTDIMRHEILYREGGFWKDAGMNLLRPIFDKFRKFKLVLPTDRLFNYRWLQGMCFFANMPKYENMLRINNYRNLNRMRIYDNDAMNIAGPIDFRQLLTGDEQLDSDILLMPYETFYPGQIIQHPEDDLCTKKKKDRVRGESYEFIDNGWYLLSNCDQLYPYAFAIEHNRYGNTWQSRRQ